MRTLSTSSIALLSLLGACSEQPLLQDTCNTSSTHSLDLDDPTSWGSTPRQFAESFNQLPPAGTTLEGAGSLVPADQAVSDSLSVVFTPERAELLVLTGTGAQLGNLSPVCPAGEALRIEGRAVYTLGSGVSFEADTTLSVNGPDVRQGWLDSPPIDVALSDFPNPYDALLQQYPCERGTRDALRPYITSTAGTGFDPAWSIDSGSTRFSLQSICRDSEGQYGATFLSGALDF